MLRLTLSIPASFAAAAALGALFPGWTETRKRLALACASAYALLASLALAKNSLEGALSLPIKASFPWLNKGLLSASPQLYCDGLAIAALAALCGLAFASSLHGLSRPREGTGTSAQSASLAMAFCSLAALCSTLPWTFAFLCCADAAAFGQKHGSPWPFAALLMPYAAAALAVFAIAGAAGTFNAPMLDVQRDAAFLPRAALDLPAWLLAAAAGIRLFVPPFSGLSWRLGRTEFLSSACTLCAVPMLWFAMLARLEPALSPALDSGALFWAGLLAMCALALRGILANDFKEAASCTAAFCAAAAFALVGLNCFQPAAVIVFAGLPACALLLASADSVSKSFSGSLFSQLGRIRFRMPVTHLAALLAVLSFAGLPPLSGFFALKSGLYGLYAAQHPAAIWIFAAASVLSAAAAIRAYHMAFNGDRGTGGAGSEAPLPELAALVFLSCGAAFFGWVVSRKTVLPLMLGLPQPKEPFIVAPLALLLAVSAALAEIFYQTRWRWQKKPSRRKPPEVVCSILNLEILAQASSLALALLMKLSSWHGQYPAKPASLDCGAAPKRTQ